MKALSIYIHVPFCIQKCHYCDFLSAPATIETKEHYVSALIDSIRTRKVHVPSRQIPWAEYEVRSVFFGGGTPSILPPEDIGRILECLREEFVFAKELEITLEANPATADARALTVWKQAGVNRLSIGVQSTDNEQLQRLGRVHTYEDAVRMYYMAREEGYHNISLDIMGALPYQSMQDYQQTLRRIVSLKPEHISVYSLMIEEGTPFYEQYKEGVYPLADERLERAMYHTAVRMLRDQGYEWYEISNFARPGYACYHNQVYWTSGEYLGFGTGAASCMDHMRFTVKDSLEDFLNREIQYRDIMKLSRKEEMEEYMFLGMRRMQGISENGFEERFGVPMDRVYGDEIVELIAKDLLWRQNGCLGLTKKGVDVSNYVFAKFLQS